jgi:hypothetical protein
VDSLSAENDVGGVVGRLMFGDAVAERRQVDPGEHRFALAPLRILGVRGTKKARYFHLPPRTRGASRIRNPFRVRRAKKAKVLLRDNLPAPREPFPCGRPRG